MHTFYLAGSITSVDILEVLSDNSMRALATPIPQNQSIKLYADITWTAGSQPVTHRWDVDTIAIATTGADTSVNGYIIFPEWTLPDGTTTFQVEVLDTGPSIIYTQTDSVREEYTKYLLS